MASQQPSGSLDVVLDKATADAVDCGGRTSDMMAEIHRVLRPAGLFMLVSCRCAGGGGGRDNAAIIHSHHLTVLSRGYNAFVCHKLPAWPRRSRDPPQRLPDVQAAFELLELAPLPAADGGPCPNAYLYCLRRRP